MKKDALTYRLRAASAVLMILALAWLTISLPYVNGARAGKAGICLQSQTEEECPSSSAPAPDSEEKTPGAGSLSEYLHHPYTLVHQSSPLSNHYPRETSDCYHAHHPEPLIPPPNC